MVSCVSLFIDYKELEISSYIDLRNEICFKKSKVKSEHNQAGSYGNNIDNFALHIILSDWDEKIVGSLTKNEFLNYNNLCIGSNVW